LRGEFRKLDPGLDKMRLMTFFLLLMAFARTPPAGAETLGKSGRFGGITIRYKVIVPNGYDAARAYPAILAFAGGGQTLDAVNNILDRNWRGEAERRGRSMSSVVLGHIPLLVRRGITSPKSLSKGQETTVCSTLQG
jgi:hypothetical protein